MPLIRRFASHALCLGALSLLPSAAAADALPGYCGMVTHAGGAAQARASGHADVAGGRAYTVDTPQPVGSVSKTFIGLALAQLVQAGEIDLDAPVGELLGWPVINPRHPARSVTLRHLATHTSGIYDDEATYASAYVPEGQPVADLGAFLRAYMTADAAGGAPSRFRRWAPGTRYEYSNIGAALAALVVETRTGTAFADHVRARILQPLHMTRSGYPGFVDTYGAQAILYDRGTPVPPYRLVTYPDGGLVSTCADLQRFTVAVIDAYAGKPSALDPAAVALMLAPQWSRSPPGVPDALANHGLFWEHRRSGAIGHTGGDPGLAALLAIEPAHASARVQLTNTALDEDAAAASEFMRNWRALGEDAPASDTGIDTQKQRTGAPSSLRIRGDTVTALSGSGHGIRRATRRVRLSSRHALASSRCPGQ
ncbi:serine hydrolase domain-containing protein [Luteimonas deserti]|uniref:Beta-lactamase family protein n=1 Tax=Luteimonas deserti TaxID=2752306 RepID=A0A7Z0QPS2_9GAMM|nr:serine hydrolase domain-containing protein [Luteimonas deserti]NYZ61934.1 beta-lactamase family protein [Luteimonas deserti]